MKKFIALGAAVAAVALGLLALAPSASAEPVGISLDLDEINGSGITGSAELTSTTEDLSVTEVLVDVGGLDPNGTHINHIHDGTGCAQGDYAGVVATLTELQADANGSASATTTVTQTDTGDPFSFTDIADGNHVLIVHDAAGAAAACEHIPQAQPPAAATATVAVSGAPATGIEGGADSGASAALIALIAGGLAAFGLASFGLGVAARRILR